MDKWQISSNLGWKKYTSRGLIFTYKLIKFWKYWRQRGLQDLCTCGQLNMYKLKPEVRQTFCVQRYHQNLLIRPAKARVTFYSTNITFFYSSKLSAIFFCIILRMCCCQSLRLSSHLSTHNACEPSYSFSFRCFLWDSSRQRGDERWRYKKWHILAHFTELSIKMKNIYILLSMYDSFSGRWISLILDFLDFIKEWTETTDPRSYDLRQTVHFVEKDLCIRLFFFRLTLLKFSLCSTFECARNPTVN